MNSPLPRPGGAQVVGDNVTVDYSRSPGFYRPDEVGGGALFRRFADLADPEAVAAFAAEYGALGLDRYVYADDKGVEPLAVWRREAALMRAMVALWDEVKAPGDHGQALADRMPPRAARGGHPEVKLWENTWGQLRYGEGGYPLDDEDVYEDVITCYQVLAEVAPAVAARLALAERLSEILARVCEVGCEVGEEGFSIVHRFSTLRGALWLGFAEAVAAGAGADLRRCGHCAQWFMVKPGTRNANAKYCTESHRQLAYQTRMKVRRSENA